MVEGLVFIGLIIIVVVALAGLVLLMTQDTR